MERKRNRHNIDKEVRGRERKKEERKRERERKSNNIFTDYHGLGKRQSIVSPFSLRLTCTSLNPHDKSAPLPPMKFPQSITTTLSSHPNPALIHFSVFAPSLSNLSSFVKIFLPLSPSPSLSFLPFPFYFSLEFHLPLCVILTSVTDYIPPEKKIIPLMC